MRPNPRTFGFLLRRSVVAAFDDNCFGIAKGAAYSALLSFFPILASAATVLVQTGVPFVSGALENWLYQIVPPGAGDLVVQQFHAAGKRPVGLLTLASVISLSAASSVIKSLIEGFHAAYRVPRNRGFFHESGVAAALALVSVVPLAAATLLIVFGSVAERAVMAWMKVDPVLHPWSGFWQWLSHVGRYVLALGAAVSVASCLLYFGPYRPRRWHYVWPGALLTAALWLLTTMGFGWYVRNMAHYNVIYGSVGAGIALLVWMYLLAASALIGCEFNAAYERGDAPPLQRSGAPTLQA
jgi:membrane protein